MMSLIAPKARSPYTILLVLGLTDNYRELLLHNMVTLVLNVVFIGTSVAQVWFVVSEFPIFRFKFNLNHSDLDLAQDLEIALCHGVGNDQIQEISSVI